MPNDNDQINFAVGIANGEYAYGLDISTENNSAYGAALLDFVAGGGWCAKWLPFRHEDPWDWPMKRLGKRPVAHVITHIDHERGIVTAEPVFRRRR